MLLVALRLVVFVVVRTDGRKDMLLSDHIMSAVE